MVIPRPLLLTPPTPAGVSLAGLVSASARLNVLGDVKSTLRAIDLPPARPGCISLNVGGREAALAARLGCPVSVVTAAATPPVDAEDRTILRWGDGAIKRDTLEMRLRRISPSALTTSPHHRAAWCNRLLDYCPESLELLVDHCGRCGRPQRWLAAEGISFCDEPGCGPLLGSGSKLSEEIASGYRRFAAICSPVPAQRAAALACLNPELAALPPITLADLALKIGLALEGAATSGRKTRCDLRPVERSRAVARGAAALEDWPLRLRAEVQKELSARGIGDGLARRELRAGLLAAGDSIRGGARLRDVVSSALPELYVEIGRSFAGIDGERMLGTVAARRLGVSHARLHQLAQAGTFEEEGVVEADYRRALYDAASIDAAAEAWRNSASIGVLMRQLGLPRYACERIIGAGDVEVETHPFALILAGQPRFRSGSFEDYAAQIRSACRLGPPPADAVRLDAAMRVVGGRLKPWRQVLDAVRRGILSVWQAPGQGPLATHLRVRPAEAARFVALDADVGVDAKALVSDRSSQLDAMTILNLAQIDGPRLAAAGMLSFETGTRSLLVRIDEVLVVARRHVATAEAAARLGMVPSAAWHRIARVLGSPSLAGWSRATFDEHFPRSAPGSHV